MFGIEGLATRELHKSLLRLTDPLVLIGLLSFFMMPASPTQTKSRFRGSGYFSEHQEKIIVNRVLRDDWTKSGMVRTFFYASLICSITAKRSRSK